ncbi:hyaluronan mediated motility receptor isoform X2 [Solea solea]|uniref:hyaluronan mediated motility receptor isoform X2 n=1 Tax=Solea solea TaxID=90069 RepID=UPI00272BFE12|nr:hyaluronan mediated motility receptor isoform X2 [Solea solea]
MSFSRAPVKRFNENVGCAPAPGSYEIKPGDLKGVASFEKSDRFRALKAAAGALLPPPSPSRNFLVSPVRRTMSVDALVEGSSVKKEKNGMTMERKQQKLLEKEIRSLVQQRGDQDRRLLALEEDLKKVEAKLLATVREKTGLSASVTTLERQRAELKRVNEFLKNKVSADTTKKRINSLTMELMEARNTLDVKSRELSVLQVNTTGHLKVLETDLQAAMATATALKDRNKDLEELHQVTKIQNEELENDNTKLHAVIRELREEIRVLQEYLDAANDQDLRLMLQEKTQENSLTVSQLQKLKQLETKLEQHNTEFETTRDILRHKEDEALKFQLELQVSKDALWEVEKRLENQEQTLKSAQKSVSDMEEQMKLANQEVHNSQATVRLQEAELARLREVLRRTEKELDERVAHLEQRCLYSEEERSKTQEEGLRRVQELKTELNLLKEFKRDEEKRKIQLQLEHATLNEELTREKALVDSLSVLVEQERKDSEEQLKQLKEEMEEVLGEFALMEEQEQRSQEMQEKNQQLQDENDELERQLNDARAQLESKGQDLAALKKEHLSATRQLQDARKNSLSKIGDIVTEMESTKEALKGAEERQKELEEEVERVTQQMKEEMDKVVKQKEEEIKRVKEGLEESQERQLAEVKAREESAKMLLEVQTRLARKDEEMKAMEVNHADQLSHLQQELQLQTKEREAALGLLEEQRGQSLTWLQNEKEKAQKLVEEVGFAKEEMMEQLNEEREEKVKIQTALEENRGALEVERKDHEQVKSQVLRLQAELERVGEEQKSLLSQLQLKDQSRLLLEDKLNVAEQDRSLLQSRLDEVVQESISFQAQLDIMEVLQHKLEEQQQDGQALQEQVEVLSQEKVTLHWEMEEQRQELQRQITEAQEKSIPSSETEHWRKQYEELFAKVRPFQEQLNAFATERNALLNENGVNQEELNKLADAYARLLGHQNQKQKIKHVIKLKDENVSLKQEVSKLRSQVSRQKSDLEQLKSNLPGAPRRRFDPSKAFQHDKENRADQASEPLREGNHYA